MIVRHLHDCTEIIAGDGTGIMHIDDESAPVTVGDVVDIPSKSVQWVENTGAQPLEFLCIVDPAWRLEDEQVVE